MEIDRKALMQQFIGEGKDREAVRRELISQGISTSGLEEEYAALVQELGVPEPKVPVPSFVTYSANDMQINASAPSLVHQKLPSIGKMLAYGFLLALKKWRAIISASVLMLLPMLFLVFLPDDLLSAPVLIGVFVIGMFISVFASTALLFTLIKTSTEEASFLDGLSWTSSKLFSVVWLGVLTSLVVLGGSLFLIVPAFIIALYNTFAFIALVKEDARGMHALLRSVDLVRGNFWGVTFTLIVFLLTSVILGALSGVVSALFASEIAAVLLVFVQTAFAAVFVGALTLLYEACAASKPLFDLSAYTKLKWTYRLLALLGILIIAGFGVFASRALPSLIQSLPLQSGIPWEREMTEESDGEALGFADVFVQSKVEATAASAKLFRGRMGFYDGVCDDITVVAPVVCRNSSEFFMVYAPLSNGKIYCTDNTLFAGVIDAPLPNSCQ